MSAVPQGLRRLVGLILVAGAVLGGLVGVSDGRRTPTSTRSLGVVGFYNPRLLYAKYQTLVDYLRETTGESWELAVSIDYQETVDDFCSGKLDLVYFGPFTYLRVRDACGASPVVRLNTNGSASYTSLIMVPRDSPFKTLADLEGRTVAYGSPLSTSSHLVPRLMLQNAGLHAGEGYECRYFGHHDRAIRAVFMGSADACGVRDIVGERFTERGLRILARSEPIPNFPLVIRPEASDAFRQSMIEVLIDRPARDPEVMRRMQAWDEEIASGFAPVSDADYDPLRKLAKVVFGGRWLTDPPERLECGPGV